MRRAILLLFGLILIVLAATPTAHAGKRVALVIGIDTYDNLPALRKAVNDHKSVAEALTGLGFDVVAGENLTRREMNAKLAELDAKIAPGDTVFFYFAGHGVALGAENYLLPRDLPKPNEGEENLVRDEGYPVDAIVRRVQGRGAAVSFFVLDACRDNPIAAAGVRSIGGTRGLTRVDAPKGVFVLFSAGMGQTALDRLGDNDPDPNSVFTRKLVPLMKTPGLTHLGIAKRVQQQVDELASTVRHPQQPAYYDQIIGEIELGPQAQVAISAAPPVVAATPAATPSGPVAEADERVDVSLKHSLLSKLPQPIASVALPIESGDEVKFLAFSPDGSKLVSSGGMLARTELWDTEKSLSIRRFKEYGRPGFLSDGRLIISEGLSTHIYDTASGKAVAEFATSRGRAGHFLISEVLSPNGSLLAGGIYADPYLIELWNVRAGKRVRTFRDDLPGLADDRQIALSADGTMLASSTGRKMLLWDANSGALLRHWNSEEAVRVLAFSPDGKILATGGEFAIDLWDVSTGHLIGSMEGQRLNIKSIAFAPDGTLLASGSNDATITLWDVATRVAARQLKEHSAPVQALAFAANGELLASGGFDGTIRVWQLPAPKTANR